MLTRSINKTIDFILRHARWVVLITVLLTVSCLPFLSRIQMDNSIDAFFDKQSKSYIDFQSWKGQFGSDQVIIVAFRDKDIFTYDNLALIEEVTRRIETVKYVDQITSLTNVNNVTGFDNYFVVRELIEDIPRDQGELNKIKKEALDNPLYVKNLISADGTATAVIIELKYMPDEAGGVHQREVIDTVRNILQEEFPQDKKYYISGLTAIETAHAVYMQRDLGVFMPLIFAIIIGILMLSFRSVAGVVLPLLAISVSFVWTLAFLYFLGFSINNITTIIPPIILAIAVADSIHFMAECVQKRVYISSATDGSTDKIISNNIKELLLPCALTTVTTAIGFFSLTISRIPPIRELGVVVGVGVFFAFIVTFTFLPALTKLSRFLTSKTGKKKVATGSIESYPFFEKALYRLGRFNERHVRKLMLMAVFLIVLAGWGMSRIKVETSILELFKKDSPIYKATTFIEENLSGVHFVNISLKAGREDYFRDPDLLRKIDDTQQFLAAIPEVDKTISVVDFLKEINQSFHAEDPRYYRVPDTKQLVAQYVLLYDADDLDDYVDSLWEWTTIRIRLNEHSTVKLDQVMDDIERYAKEKFGGSIAVELVGQTVLEVETNNAVTDGQIKSLLLAMFFIFGMFFFVFKSFPVGIVGIIPNALPLLVNFGIMGACGIRLNSATSMISAIAIGIIVDDTIHYLHSYQAALRQSRDYVRAMYTALIQKGRPIVLTSLILCCGFGVVMFSEFGPSFYFGVLSSILMLNALWADLVILPCVLMWIKPRFRSQ
ncbi:MAG: RND family transporter [Candidatus Omnitrophica bacterium]|nr:RND family transporter [Candidatus Omnitrophota bacterium]